MAHRKPLRRHPGPLCKAERQDRIGARTGLVTPGEIIPEWWARSSRNGGRHQIGTVGEMIPEWWARSSGISKSKCCPNKKRTGCSGECQVVVEWSVARDGSECTGAATVIVGCFRPPEP